MPHNYPRLLFIINPGAGNRSVDWKKEIQEYFSGQPYTIYLYDFPDPCRPDMVRAEIDRVQPARVIAVGGDGTVKLVATCLQQTGIPLGILPAGSANGMARELGISDEPEKALRAIAEGRERKIHLIKLNEELCIHLSDIGFNAFVIKKFEGQRRRGMWGYVKAAWKVLWQNRRMLVKIQTDEDHIWRKAAMVVIANATRYGNGVVINPEGSLYDRLFEVVIIRKVSFSEIFKMRFTRQNFNPAKTEFFQTRSLQIESASQVHFQVDGEYMGKLKKITATLLPDALTVLVPPEKK